MPPIAASLPRARAPIRSLTHHRIQVIAVAALLLGGCASTSVKSRVVTPPPTHSGTVAASGTRQIVARAQRYLRDRSYTVDYHVASTLPGGELLVVFHSVCTGSVDGHCQAVDAFRQKASQPVWHGEYTSVLAVRPSKWGFAVRSVSYAAGDPLCCPTGQAVTDTYTWTGSGFKESGPLPGRPSTP